MGMLPRLSFCWTSKRWKAWNDLCLKLRWHNFCLFPATVRHDLDLLSPVVLHQILHCLHSLTLSASTPFRLCGVNLALVLCRIWATRSGRLFCGNQGEWASSMERGPGWGGGKKPVGAGLYPVVLLVLTDVDDASTPSCPIHSICSTNLFHSTIFKFVCTLF